MEHDDDVSRVLLLPPFFSPVCFEPKCDVTTKEVVGVMEGFENAWEEIKKQNIESLSK